jgi:hypothetical protein
MKEELNAIIDEMKEVLEKAGFHLSDFEIMDLALRLYNTEQINKSRDYPAQFNSFQKSQGREPFTKPKDKLTNEEKTDEDLATSKQKYFLEKNNVAVPEGLTKKKASEFIKKIKG